MKSFLCPCRFKTPLAARSFPPRRRTSCAFTLVEALASVALLGLILTGFLVSYQRTVERISRESIRTRALAIAQKKIEMLLAANQEPDPTEMQGQDEEEPLFTWKMELKRVPIGDESPKPDLSNTLIEAKVTVRYDSGEEEWVPDEEWSRTEELQTGESSYDEEWGEEYEWTEKGDEIPAVELIRYIAALKPLSEGSLAVTPGPQEVEDPDWLKELRKSLGREPTFDEILQKMFEAEGSSELAEMLNLPQENPQ